MSQGYTGSTVIQGLEGYTGILGQQGDQCYTGMGFQGDTGI